MAELERLLDDPASANRRRVEGLAARHTAHERAEDHQRRGAEAFVRASWSGDEAEEAARFETLACELSARFVHLPGDRVDEAITQSLREIVEFLNVDRSSLGE